MVEIPERNAGRDGRGSAASRVPQPAPGLDVGEDHQSGVAVASLPGGRHFELSQASACLLRLVDGRRSLQEIALALEAEGSNAPDVPALEHLIRTRFLPLGLVSFDGAQQVLPRPRSRMWVHVPLIRGDAAGHLASALVFLFRRPLVMTAILVGAAANLWMLARWGVLGWDWNSSRAAAGAGGMGLFLVSNLVHELGHATALRSRGERPGDIGIGMYYLFPVFYCDVSSAWRLSPRRRIPVDLGGLYFHLIFTLGLAAGFALTGSEMLLWAALMVNLSMVSNLNPFLRFDGYWLMADISGVRDLRGTTREVLRRALRRNSASAPAAGASSPWLHAYALGSCLYFLGLAVFIGWRVVPGAIEDLRQAGRLLGGGLEPAGDALPGDAGSALLGIVVLAGVLVLLAVGVRSLILLLRADRTPVHD